MKRLSVVLAVFFAFALLGVLVQPALAYSAATGCVVDGRTSQPWTHGGTITATYTWNGNTYTASQPLGNDGCFDTGVLAAGIDNLAWTVTIDLNPGPAGTPDPLTCNVPAGGLGQSYDCGTMATNTGPNAVVLSQLAAAPAASRTAPALAGGGAFLAVLGLVAFWRRR